MKIKNIGNQTAYALAAINYRLLLNTIANGKTKVRYSYYFKRYKYQSFRTSLLTLMLFMPLISFFVAVGQNLGSIWNIVFIGICGAASVSITDWIGCKTYDYTNTFGRWSASDIKLWGIYTRIVLIIPLICIYLIRFLIK